MRNTAGALVYRHHISAKLTKRIAPTANAAAPVKHALSRKPVARKAGIFRQELEHLLLERRIAQERGPFRNLGPLIRKAVLGLALLTLASCLGRGQLANEDAQIADLVEKVLQPLLGIWVSACRPLPPPRPGRMGKCIRNERRDVRA